MSAFDQNLDWIEAQKAPMIARLKAWVAINSGSRNFEGLKAMEKAAREAFAPLKADVEAIPVRAGEDVNGKGERVKTPFGPVLHFSKRPKAKRRVLLTGHLDTVFGKEHPFQGQKILDANTLNGPGAADMKGGILVMLTALTALEQSKHAANLGYDVLLSSDEEVGSIGSGPVLAKFAKRAQLGMTYEPSLPDGTLAGERKGSGNFTVIVRGVSAHAGREFEKGVNAVAALGRLIVELHALNGKKPGLTVNPAVIEGGRAVNVVPDLAILRFNVRIRDAGQAAWFEAAFRNMIAKYKKREGLRIETFGLFSRPPKKLTPANRKLFHVLKDCGRAIGVPVAWRPSGGVCEGNNLAAAGLPNIDTLGVCGGHIHTAREFVRLGSLTERAKLSALLLLNFAAGNFDLET
ncbi:MAG TPA: hydrolase [Sphingomonadales bacterium]|nr:hydrolase [Sphingomonadales bacterium]